MKKSIYYKPNVSDNGQVVQIQVAQNDMFCNERIYINSDNHTKQNVIKWYILQNKLIGCLVSEMSLNMAALFFFFQLFREYGGQICRLYLKF